MATVFHEATSQRVNHTQQAGNRPWVRSMALSALLAFIAVNVLLWTCWGAEKQTSKDLWSGAGSIDLALDDFNHLPTRPDVVLLGSSLVMFPFWAVDKDRDPKHTSDIFHYHRSRMLEKNMSNVGFNHPLVFNMAIFGQMASDAFLYVDEYLKSNKRPDYLVFGIAPRDFADADVQSPMATISFKRLVNLSNFPHFADLYLPTWQSRCEFVVEHLCFLYGRRWKLQHEFGKAVAKGYLQAGWITGTASASSAATAKRGFLFSSSTADRWRDSLDEYRRRYRNIENKDMHVQLGFFTKILEVCHQRGIKVVVVNMPLTAANRGLLPDGWYLSFTSNLEKICNRPGVRFLDLGSNPDFVRGDFWDTTHLAHPGGYKLINYLTAALAARSVASTAQRNTLQ